MSKLLILTLLAVSAFAGPVLVTAHGKTYHSRKCGILAWSGTTYTVDEGKAKEHGLKPCRSCYKTDPAKTATPDWLKDAKKDAKK